jgi:hypothetical protein
MNLNDQVWKHLNSIVLFLEMCKLVVESSDITSGSSIPYQHSYRHRYVDRHLKIFGVAKRIGSWN